jgi:hypothetical protein
MRNSPSLAVPEWSRIDKNRTGVAMDLDLGVSQRIEQHPPIEPQVARKQLNVDPREQRPVSIGAPVRMARHRMRQLVQQAP